MTVRELRSLRLYDENERVAIISPNSVDSTTEFERIWKGCLGEIPPTYLDKVIFQVGALSLRECEKHYNLPVSQVLGWTGIFIEED